MTSVAITVDIAPALAEELRTLARRMGEDEATIAGLAIRSYVDDHLEMLDFLQQGIDATDRGETYTQEEVEAWLEARYRDVAAE